MQNTKEVYFHQYCPTCKHREVSSVEDPCDECLEHFVNEDSHKPIRYVEDSSEKNKTDRAKTCMKKKPSGCLS